MCKKEVLVAESPKDADAGHARIACRLYVNVAVAYIYRPFRCYAELLHRLYYGVGSRLLAYVLTLADGNGHKLVTEEMTTKLLRCRIKLIAYHSHLLATALQFMQQFHHTVVRTRSVKVVLHVMLAEVGIGLVERRIIETAGNGTLHELLHTVAHKSSNLVDGALRHAIGGKSIVATGCKVSKGGQQGAVKVEYVSVIHD